LLNFAELVRLPEGKILLLKTCVIWNTNSENKRVASTILSNINQSTNKTKNLEIRRFNSSISLIYACNRGCSLFKQKVSKLKNWFWNLYQLAACHLERGSTVRSRHAFESISTHPFRIFLKFCIFSCDFVKHTNVKN